jgi:AcrR family transcriptional regulator
MSGDDKAHLRKRSYNAPKRVAAADRTRDAILSAAKIVFEERGWAGSTLRAIADRAGVSPKTIEASFGTKARLLAATVTYAIRGDVDSVEMRRRPQILELESIPSAAEMLDRHAEHLRRVNGRSARIAFVVEQAAAADAEVRQLWDQMNRNRLAGVRWAAGTLLAKPGTNHLSRRLVEPVFLVAFDWGTYRVLTEVGRLSPERYEAWLKAYYRQLFLQGDGPGPSPAG